MKKLLDAADFKQRLKAVGSKRYHDRHGFHIRMHEGKLSRQEIRAWILNRFYYQKNIPVKDAIILSKLPGREYRRQWIKRLIDHDGTRPGEGGIEAWLALGAAAGIDREAMLDDSRILPAVRFAVDRYVNFCSVVSWQEAVAASLTELFAPNLIRRRIEMMEKHYSWIDRKGLDYFRVRLDQAPEDAAHALNMVLEGAATPDLQERAIAAVSFKCDVLQAMLDALEHHFSCYRQAVV